MRKAKVGIDKDKQGPRIDVVVRLVNDLGTAHSSGVNKQHELAQSDFMLAHIHEKYQNKQGHPRP